MKKMVKKGIEGLSTVLIGGDVKCENARSPKVTLMDGLCC